MATRRELTTAVWQRYKDASRAEKVRILDHFVVVTGFHRKHAMRLLRGDIGQSSVRRTRRRIYEEAERNALVVLWEASDRICGKRLKALLPLLIESMERNGHMGMAPEIRAKLLVMSASTIDWALGKIRQEGGRQCRRPVASALPTGRIRRWVSSKPIWSPTADPRRATVLSRRGAHGYRERLERSRGPSDGWLSAV